MRLAAPPVRRLLTAALAAIAVGATAIAVAPKEYSPLPAGARAAHSLHGGLLGLPLAARGPANAAIGAKEPRYRVTTDGAGLAATSPAQHLSARFAAGGVSVSSGSAHLSLGLRSVRYGSAQQTLAPVAPRGHTNRVLYAHPGLLESYANGPLGIEQGFTVARAPRAHAGGGALTLSLALSGNTHAALAAGGQAVSFSRDGATVLRYTGLFASDARGRSLRSWLSLDGSTLVIHVDSAGARYPLHIDPLLQQGAKLTGGAYESGATEESGFGTSVAVSGKGNVALVGDPENNLEEGTVWVFTRSGSTWSFREVIDPTPGCGCEEFGRSVSLSGDGKTALIGGDGAWVYEEVAGKYEEQAELKDTPKVKSFGHSVALSFDGSTAIVGAPKGTPLEEGAAYVFTRGSGWNQVGGQLTGQGEVGQGRFGYSVAIDGTGTTALIGAPSDGSPATPTGAIFIFIFNGTSWVQKEEHEGPQVSMKIGLGASVALSYNGETALVGAPGQDKYAVVYQYQSNTGKWEEAQTLNGGEGFGESVALAPLDETAVVGESEYHEEGRAWVYTYNAGTKQYESPYALTGSGQTYEGFFGESVAVSEGDEEVLIGGGFTDGLLGAAWAFGNEAATAPTVEAEPATFLAETEATVNAIVKPNGSTITGCEYEYGTSSVSEHSASCLPVTGSNAGALPVPLALSGLVANTTYKYRIVAENSVGSKTGSEKEFTTLQTSSSGTSTSPSTSASASISGLTATSGLGEGTVTVGQYGSNPTGDTPPFEVEPSVPFIDVWVSPDHTFASVEVEDCKVNSNSTEMFWFNPQTSSYEPIVPTQVITGPPHCLDVTLTETSKPKLSQLTGSVFAVAVPVGAPPAIKKLSVKKGAAAGGTTVTITGSGLIGTTEVNFGESPAASYTVNSATSITATAPAHATGAIELSVRAPGGLSAATKKAKFTFEAPTIASVSPSSGSVEGGTRITLQGTGFAPGNATTVKFGKAESEQVDCTSTTTCKAVVPEGKNPGKLDVRAQVGNKTSKKNPPGDQFEYK